MTKLEPTGAWMNPAQVTAWIAFRDARPFEQWDAFVADTLNRSWDEWGFWLGITGLEGQARSLLAALQSRAAGQAWRGPTGDFGGKRSFRAHVRRLMRRSGASATALASQLEEDIRTQTEIDKCLEEARLQMVRAVRDELLNALGHRALDDGKSNPSAVAERIAASLFLGPRTINYDGWLRADVDRRLEEWADYGGPFFDRVHFRTSDVLILWPADGAGNAEPHRMIQRGGRRPLYDWAAFAREMIRLANKPDGLPDRPTLQKHMFQWCEDTWDKSPSDSTFRDMFAQLYPEEN